MSCAKLLCSGKSARRFFGPGNLDLMNFKKEVTMRIAWLARLIVPLAFNPIVAFGETSSSLVIEKIGNNDSPACFGSGKIAQAQYTYKKIEAKALNRTMSLRAYAAYPPNFDPKKKYPAVLFFHGGGWLKGSPIYWLPTARYFASRGAIGISFQYRIKWAHHSTPEETTADALSAVEWTRKFANELHVDAAKVAVLGDSAGGHLALATALVKGPTPSGLSRPNAIVAFYPMSDTAQLAPAPEEKETDPSALAHPSISPLALIDEAEPLPPTLILHGTQDRHPWAPYEKAQQLCARANARAKKAICELIPYEGRIHAFMYQPYDYVKGLMDVDRFLTQEKFLAPPRRPVSDLIINGRPTCRFDLKSYEEEMKAYGYESNASGLWPSQ